MEVGDRRKTVLFFFLASPGSLDIGLGPGLTGRTEDRMSTEESVQGERLTLGQRIRRFTSFTLQGKEHVFQPYSWST